MSSQYSVKVSSVPTSWFLELFHYIAAFSLGCFALQISPVLDSHNSDLSQPSSARAGFPLSVHQSGRCLQAKTWGDLELILFFPFSRGSEPCLASLEKHQFHIFHPLFWLFILGWQVQNWLLLHGLSKVFIFLIHIAKSFLLQSYTNVHTGYLHTVLHLNLPYPISPPWIHLQLILV